MFRSEKESCYCNLKLYHDGGQPLQTHYNECGIREG
jgi:hypothetical protein